MSLEEYASRELECIKDDEYGMKEEMTKNVLDIVRIFQNQGHSGFSASYAIYILERVLRFKPITALTGKDDEWNEPYIDGWGNKVYQNKRCSSVFKSVDNDGNMVSCHDNDAIIVSDDGGLTWFTSSETHKHVTFPYFPPTHPEKLYIERDDSEKGWHVVTSPERIKEMQEELNC